MWRREEEEGLVARGPTLTYAISTPRWSWDHLTSFGLRNVGGRPGTQLVIGVAGGAGRP